MRGNPRDDVLSGVLRFIYGSPYCGRTTHARAASSCQEHAMLHCPPFQSTRAAGSDAPTVSGQCASMVVVAGRPSDFGLPTGSPLPTSPRDSALAYAFATFRSHHRCGTAPDSHRLSVSQSSGALHLHKTSLQEANGYRSPRDYRLEGRENAKFLKAVLYFPRPRYGANASGKNLS